MAPVADHPVSEMTKRTGREPYGCNNKPRASGYWCMVRQYRADGSFEMVQQFVRDVMSPWCQYDAAGVDLRCAWCGKNDKVECPGDFSRGPSLTDGFCGIGDEHGT